MDFVGFSWTERRSMFDVHSAVKKEDEYIGNSRQGFPTLCKYNEISDTVQPLIRRIE